MLFDWLIIIATLLGPILAVQAQKWVERSRERRERKLIVFRSLMATRAARLSPEHVQSLNMIDVAFYRRNGHPSTTERRVLDSWKEYLDHLNSQLTSENSSQWMARSVDLFASLLLAVSQDLGYSYDKVQLNKGAYSPKAHGNFENDQARIRKLMIDVLSGDQALKMSVSELPAHPDALATLASQRAASDALRSAISGETALNVRVIEPPK